jgi:hypothetical protein
VRRRVFELHGRIFENFIGDLVNIIRHIVAFVIGGIVRWRPLDGEVVGGGLRSWFGVKVGREKWWNCRESDGIWWDCRESG